MLMRYTEFRLAKRHGEVVWQRRYITTTTRSVSPWWKFWECNYELDKVYGDWADMPMPEIGDE